MSLRYFVFIGLLCLTCDIRAADDSSSVASGEIQGVFGIGGSNARTRLKSFESWIPQMKAIGINTTRGLGGTGWTGQAQRTWDTLDWQLEYLHGQGFSSGGGFYNYRAGKEKSGLPMDDLPGWSADVYQLVQHFKGRIKYWEVWNEPPNGTRRGQTAQDYATFVKVTYDAAKKADPNCLVGIAAKSAALNYLDAAIKSGAKGHFDYVTLHPYEILGNVISHPGHEAIYMSIAPTVRNMLAAQDPDKVNVPIIFTEIGYDAGKSPEKQAEAVIKAYTMDLPSEKGAWNLEIKPGAVSLRHRF